MDIKEYISSGILELYSAGALAEQEAREVEAMAAKHPEVQAELNAIAEAYVNYASSFSRNPRPALRGQILDEIDKEEGISKPGVDKGKILQMPDSGAIKQNYERRFSRMRYLMAAVFAFLVLNIITNFVLMYKWRNTSDQMAQLVSENTKMKNEYEQIKNDMDKKTGEMKMVMNRSNKIVDLKGMEISPNSFATVYWNPNSKQVMLNVDNLPQPPTDKQYQLWALKDGKPIDAGVFDMDKDAMHNMKAQIADADAFAITLEKKGGSPAPTLTQLYLMGKI